MRHRTTITVDDLLWRRFESLLALEDKDMSAVLEQLVEDYIEANEADAREERVNREGRSRDG